MNKQKLEISVWCQTHPTKTVGQDQYGNFYDTCYEGYKEKMAGKKPTCVIIEETRNEVNHDN